MLQNNTGKVIFEDVSEEFVPLFSNEREADRIKEIKIRGENNITSLFLISLIERKSNVEYNIHMQIFRYMVYIWERYERRMEQKQPGCTRRKDFTYPPIIPIVMLINKLQTIDDVEQFRALPAGKVDEILKDTFHMK